MGLLFHAVPAVVMIKLRFGDGPLLYLDLLPATDGTGKRSFRFRLRQIKA